MTATTGRTRRPELTRRDARAMAWIGEQYGARFDVLAVLLGRESPKAEDPRFRDHKLLPGQLLCRYLPQTAGRCIVPAPRSHR